MDALFAKWWYGGILLPSVITVAIGGPVSVYLAVVVSRFFLFYQAREAAALAVYNTFGNVRSLSQSSDAPYDIGSPFNPYIYSLEHAGHRMAASVVTGVFNEIFFRLFQAAGHDLTGLSEHQYLLGQFPRFPAIPPPKIAEFKARFLLSYSTAIMERLEREIISAQPNWFALFGLPTAERIWYNFFPISVEAGRKVPVKDPTIRPKFVRRRPI